VVYQYSFKRSQNDNRAINKMIERAEAVATGTRPLKNYRFVKITDATKAVDWKLAVRARYLAGLEGFVTNIGIDTMYGPQVVAAYNDLYQIERSFRMAKSDLAARPIFHRIRDSIEAHLTIVFTALAVSREATKPKPSSTTSKRVVTKPIQLRSEAAESSLASAAPRLDSLVCSLRSRATHSMINWIASGPVVAQIGPGTSLPAGTTLPPVGQHMEGVG
jgi:hypothetical protein